MINLPIEDGYYWMRNIAGEEALKNVNWRVVQIFNSPDYGTKKRVARDGQRLYTAEYLSAWEGIEFHGPLVPPSV